MSQKPLSSSTGPSYPPLMVSITTTKQRKNSPHCRSRGRCGPASNLTSPCSLAQSREDFRSALADSFNTPAALDVLLELISRTNIYLSRGRASVNVPLVEMIATWLTKMLRMFGLGEGAVSRGTIGWGEVEKDGETTVDVRIPTCWDLQQH